MDIMSEKWGISKKGIPILLYTLQDDILVKITNYGATITSIQCLDKKNQLNEVILGFESLDGYLSSVAYHGSTIGRYANRINNGTFMINNEKYNLPTNDGCNHLHGGYHGFDKYIWSTDIIGNQSVKMSLTSPDGDMGYPGTVNCSVTFSVVGNQFEIDYFATTNKATIINLTNHAYFNLGTSKTVDDHVLCIDADLYTPIDEEFIPLGPLDSVVDSPFDFRNPIRIGDMINEKNYQLKLGKGYDHNFVLNHIKSPQVSLYEPSSGRVLEISTTMPGLQFYSGNFLDGSEFGRGGSIGFRSGLCLETQFFPDSPNNPEYPSAILSPGEKYVEKTIYRFRVER
jgi:aldose 1-epimerase